MVTRLRHITTAVAVAVAGVCVVVAASVWNARSALAEVAGGALIVAAAWSLSKVAGMATAGVWLSMQAYGMRRGDPS